MAKLPFVINDGKWHHICITWTTRDGVWEAYQDGTQGGHGENLAPYHPIKPQGVLVLGQEQVLPGTRGRSAAGEEEVGGEGGERRWRGKRFPLGGSPGKQLHSFGPSPCSAWACWETQAAPARRPTLSSCSKTFLVVGRLVLPLAMHNLFPGSGLSPIGHPGGTRWESPRLLLPLGGLLAESSV